MPDAAAVTLALNKDLEATFSTEPGARALAWMHTQAFMDETTVDQTVPVDLTRMAIREGRRQLVLEIRRRIAQVRAPAPQKVALTGPKDGNDG